MEAKVGHAGAADRSPDIVLRSSAYLLRQRQLLQNQEMRASHRDEGRGSDPPQQVRQPDVRVRAELGGRRRRRRAAGLPRRDE